MSVGELEQLIRSLERLPVAAILTELSTRKLLAVNAEAAAILDTRAEDLVGSDVLAHIDSRDRDAARTAYAAMAGEVIDAYQAQRRLVTPSGQERAVTVSGRRVDAANGLYGLWILLPAAAPSTAIETLMFGAPAVVLAVTDHDWQIEYMTADADLLGVKGAELRGFPLLGLVHPSATTALLAAAERAATEHLAVTVLTNMRTGDGEWADRYCVVVPICNHQPPRLGVVITAITPTSADLGSGSKLDEHLRQAAIEARAMQTLDAIPALAQLPPGSELSARQTEIVARLAAGESQADIARSMFLSPSTVRNHLTAVYRKFGVHSQAQLLAAVLRALATQKR
jgi:DNA-binding CsgD family transcriptional regulator/PAS domain-containing protein